MANENSKLLSIYNSRIQEIVKWEYNGTDMFIHPRINESTRAAARNNFGTGMDETILLVRDTSFWDNCDQGLVMTTDGIYCIPDNENSESRFVFGWHQIKEVKYQELCLYFYDYEGNYYPIHMSYFVKSDSESTMSNIGRKLAPALTQLAQAVAPLADPSEEADAHIQELVNADKYSEAIPYIRKCIQQFPQYAAWYNERLAMCFYFNEDYMSSIKAANAGLKSECTEAQVSQLCLWKYSSNEELGNWEDARKDALFVAVNGSEEQNDEGMSQRDYARDDFFRLNDHFVEHFLEIPYQERKVLMVVDTYQNLYQDHIQVLGSAVVQNFDFPMGHPIANQLYIGHPLIPNKYIPFDSYQLEFVEDKVREFCQLAQSLGATEITIDCLNSTSSNNTTSGKQNVRGNVDTWYDVSGGHSKEYKYHMIEELSKSISLHQTFQPKDKPYVPEGLVWYDCEPSWQRLVSQRLNGGLTSHEERIETKKSQMLEGRELTEIKAEVKSLIVDMGMTFDKTEEQKFTQQENAVLSIKVSFAPIQSWGGSQQMSSKQSTSNTKALNSQEQEYLEEVKECLIDGEIGSRERRLLEKLRVKLGITSERAASLENSLKPSLTDDEKEYQEEYKSIIADGEITPRERRLLDKLRTMLDISEARAKEIESLV